MLLPGVIQTLNCSGGSPLAFCIEIKGALRTGWPGVSVFHLYILILCDTSGAKIAFIPWGPKQAPRLLGKE